MANTTMDESRRIHRGMNGKKGRYEGSAKDIRQDAAGARRTGVSVRKYEGSPADRRQDKAGQRRLTKRGK